MDFLDIDTALQTDSFLLEDYVQEDEINQIFRKWKQQMPQQRTESTNHHTNPGNTKLTFDSRTYTRPKKKGLNQINERESLDCYKIKEMSLESGIDSINLQIGGPLSMTPVSMQRSWLNDVSPPNSICTSMDFQMANSLITSSDFTNISFLQNNSEDDIKRTFNNVDVLVNEDDEEDLDISLKNTSDNQINNATFAQLRNSNCSQQLNSTFPLQKSNNSTFLREKMNSNSTFSQQLDTTFPKQRNSTFSHNVEQHKNSTYNRDSTFTAVKNNVLDDLLDSDEVLNDSDKNKTFDKYSNPEPRTLLLNHTFMQSTPVALVANKIPTDQDVDLSPIGSVNRAKQNNRINRNLTRIVQQAELENEEDEEFLFEENNAPINETFNCEMNETNEKEFEEMLNNLTTVKKSNQSDKLIETLKKYSFTNIEKQKKEILNDAVSDSNKIQNNDVMLLSTERLLNRRSRLYDDVNLQIALSQKQNEINKSFTSDKSSTTSDSESTSKEKADSVSTSSENIEMAENHHNSDDRFKTIRLSHKEGILNERNRYTKEMPEENDEENGEENYRDRFKTIRLSKKIPTARPEENKTNSKLKSPMGFKSKSCQSLVNNNGNMKLFATNNNSNLMMVPPATQTNYNNNQIQNKRLQTNLRMPRASSLVRPVSSVEQTRIRQSQYPKSVEDICSESSSMRNNNTGAVTKLQQSIQRPSNLRQPSAKIGLSGLPRPTFYSKK